MSRKGLSVVVIVFFCNMLASPGQDVRDITLSKIFQDSGELRKKLSVRKTICLGNNTRSYSCILFFLWFTMWFKCVQEIREAVLNPV